MSGSTKHVPFKTNFEALEAALDVLQARCARLTAQAKLREVEAEEADPSYTARPGRSDARMARCALLQRSQEEDRLRAAFAARLRTHRATPATPNVGLLQIERDYGLGEDEQTILLVALVHALGSSYEDRIFGGVLPPSYNGPEVSDMLRILDPVGLDDHVQARSYFRPSSALMKSGLLVLGEDRSGIGHADALLSLTIKLTLRGWAVIMLDPGALTEGATAPVTDGL